MEAIAKKSAGPNHRTLYPNVMLLPDSGTVIHGQILEMNQNSLCIAANQPVRKGETVTLIIFGSSGGSPEKRRCQVMWVERKEKGTYQAGLKAI